MGVILIIEVLEYRFLRLLIYIKEQDGRVNSALKMVFEESGGVATCWHEIYDV